MVIQQWPSSWSSILLPLQDRCSQEEEFQETTVIKEGIREEGCCPHIHLPSVIPSDLAILTPDISILSQEHSHPCSILSPHQHCIIYHR